MNIKKYKIEQINYCINCEYNCESVCPIFNLMKIKDLTPKNKAIKALKSINKLEFLDNSSLYACTNCNNCKNYCPHRNEISEVLEYAKEKIISTGYASEDVLKFEEDFYRRLDEIEFLEINHKLLIKNIPNFLAFYNLGFRDEAITELKDFFRKLNTLTSFSKEEIIVEDMSFIYIVKKTRQFFKNIKIPKIKYNFEKTPDYNKILTSGFEITLPDMYKKLSEKLNHIKQN